MADAGGNHCLFFGIAAETRRTRWFIFIAWRNMLTPSNKEINMLSLHFANLELALARR